MTGNLHIQRALNMLENSPLKLTSQRVSLIKTLFKEGNQHFSAEDVYKKVKNTGVRISLATIYNCLNQFTSHGILKMVKASSDKVYFDTNLKKGTILKRKNLKVVRPFLSTEPKDLSKILGKKLKKDVRDSELVNLKNLKN